jgi:polyferredoxin
MGSYTIAFFEAGSYDWMTTTVCIAALILIVAFFVPKFWCRYACPVGAIAKLTDGVTHSD